ncbi:MAG: cytochrome c [Desulfatiglans sp.]|jgi:mono/diheme cytochrome c family protein|nr:cytochrome c [Desulfatiglans sp.]
MGWNNLFAAVKERAWQKHEEAGKNWLAFIAFAFCISFIFSVAYSHAQDGKTGDMKKFYQVNCVRCHGADGSAIGVDGKKLKGEDFTDPRWQKNTDDEKMIKVILNGKFFGLAMPGYKEIITREDAKRIVTEIIRKSEKGKIIAP